MKCFINEEEWYPVYELLNSDPVNNDGFIPVELMTNEIERIKKAFTEFNAVQDLIGSRIEVSE